MAKKAILVLGIVLLVVGIWGYVSDPILGVFEVDGLHNLIHIVTGVLGIVFGMRSVGEAKMFSKVFGVIYALVAILGLVLPGDMILGLIESNMADDILHVVLAVVFLYLGFSRSEQTVVS